MVWTESNPRWPASISWARKMRRRRRSSSWTIRWRQTLTWLREQFEKKLSPIFLHLDKSGGNSLWLDCASNLRKFYPQFFHTLTNQGETAFDQIVGAIEDIVIDDRFQDLQTDLLEKHFHHFDVSNRPTKIQVPQLWRNENMSALQV